jgi:hypothetical protein
MIPQRCTTFSPCAPAFPVYTGSLSEGVYTNLCSSVCITRFVVIMWNTSWNISIHATCAATLLTEGEWKKWACYRDLNSHYWVITFWPVDWPVNCAAALRNAVRRGQVKVIDPSLKVGQHTRRRPSWSLAETQQYWPHSWVHGAMFHSS